MITNSKISYMAIPMVMEYEKKVIGLDTKTIQEKKKDIEIIVCREMAVSIEDAYSRTSKKEIVSCRHILFYFFNKHKLTTKVAMGRWFNKDHATVIHGLKKVQDQADIYPEYRMQLEKLSIMINLKLN